MDAVKEATGAIEVAQPPGRFSSPLIPIFLIVLVDVLGFTIILPLLPFYSEHLGASPTDWATLLPDDKKPAKP